MAQSPLQRLLDGLRGKAPEKSKQPARDAEFHKKEEERRARQRKREEDATKRRQRGRGASQDLGR